MGNFDLAMKSYKCLDKQLAGACDMDWYNILAAECEQIVEKFMKAVLECFNSEDFNLSLYDSHNISKIGRIINQMHPNTVNPEKVSWLKDFYFDTRYPRDNCYYVSQ